MWGEATTYAEPGPLPVVFLPLHFRQKVCLKGWQQLLHHQVTQDLPSGRGREPLSPLVGDGEI